MAHSSEPILNLVAPRPATWNDVFGIFSRSLNIPLIPYDEWAAKVTAAADSNTTKEHLQAFALADFFTEIGSESRTLISTDKAVKEAKSLDAAPALGEQDVMKYLAYWRKRGFIS
jgi:hypothetical protein